MSTSDAAPPTAPDDQGRPGLPATEPSDVGRRVRARRLDRGLSRDDLARAAGMATTYLRYLEESARAVPTADAVSRLASALRTTATRLRGSGTGAPGSGAHDESDPVVEVLDEATCRELLLPGGVARVVYTDASGPVAVPVNVVVVGDDVVFQTGAGSVGAAVASGSPVSIELDHLDPVLGEGWSVLVRGTATVDGPGTSGPAVESWAGAPRTTTVRLHTDQLTGRRVSRPQ